MRKNRVNAILNNRARREKIMNYAIRIVVITIIFCFFLSVYLNKNKKQYVTYNETSSVDYKVYLKENDFFDKSYLEKDNQYIASLMDYITANFNYKLSIDEKDIDYKYSYRIEAEVNVKEEKTNNSLYNYKEELLEEKSFTQNSNNNVEINEEVKIDYNKYNNHINKFISVYELADSESTLNINMYINVIGSCEKFESNSEGEYVVTLSIPLTTKTVAVDINSEIVENDENILVCKTEECNPIIKLLMIITLLIDVYLIIRLIRFEITSRTAESIYERELKKILNNYKSYIQKINNDMDLEGYKVLEVDTFTDMLEIRDTIQEPILMIESEKKDETYFMIPGRTNILYVYGLKVSDIKVRKNKKNRFATSK